MRERASTFKRISLPARPISLRARDPFVRISLWDGRHTPVPLPTDVAAADFEVSPGVYVVRFATSGWQCEVGALVFPDQEGVQVVEPTTTPLVRSAAPLERSSISAAGDAQLAANASRTEAPEIMGPATGSLF